MRQATENGINRSESKQSRLFSRISSEGSSLERRFSSNIVSPQTDDDVESATVSQAGDVGDRALQSHMYIESDPTNYIDGVTIVPTVENNVLLQSYNFRFCDPSNSPQLSLPSEINKDEDMDTKKKFPWWLEYISCFLHLAVFGIFGVLTRYLLRKLFGPGLADITSSQSILYLDLPSNMVGSFLMGWFGVVFKGDISNVSDFLAIGLSTGYLGSLTTFSGWNQNMLSLSVKGHWLHCMFGFLIGLFLAAYSLIFGVETANGFRELLKRSNLNFKSSTKNKWRVDTYMSHLAIMLAMIIMLNLLWGMSGTLAKREFSQGGEEAELWLACLIGPIGVWVRWLLARLNGRRLGKTGLFKWVPFGTLAANVSAACVMAALETLKSAVSAKNCDTLATAMQFGFLGCLSTVSTFIAEFNAMRQSNHPWRAYAYATITIGISFGMGTLIYSIPVWVKGYH